MRQQKHAHYNGKGRVHYNGTRPRSSLKSEWDIVMQHCGICGAHYKSTTWTPCLSSLVVIFTVQHRPLSLSVIGDHHLLQSIAIAIAIAICHQSLLSIVSCCCCWLSLVITIGCRHWLSVIVIIIVAVSHGCNCNRCTTSHGYYTSMAKGTTSVKPAGKAEKATAARPEAL